MNMNTMKLILGSRARSLWLAFAPVLAAVAIHATTTTPAAAAPAGVVKHGDAPDPVLEDQSLNINMEDLNRCDRKARS